MNVPANRWSALMAGLALLEDGQPDAARSAVEGHERSGIGRAIALVAEGLEHERDGRLDDADRCFGEVYEQGAPVAALLRECARFFARRGDHGRAFQCFAILDDFEGETGLSSFLEGLSGPELARYAPLLVRLPRSEEARLALVERFGEEPGTFVYEQLGG